MAPPGAFEHCRRVVAQIAKERHWATLFAPVDRRDALYALYAFDHELSRVSKVAREPIAAEIRLQWWREIVGRMRDTEAAGHPVAAALLETIDRHDWLGPRLVGLIDAWGHEPHAAGHPSQRDSPAVVAVELAAGILDGHGTVTEHIAQHASLAQICASHGRSDEARDHLDAARELLPHVPPQVLPALLPFAVIGPSLDRPLPAWRRQWLIWRAGRQPRRIFG